MHVPMVGCKKTKKGTENLVVSVHTYLGGVKFAHINCFLLFLVSTSLWNFSVFGECVLYGISWVCVFCFFFKRKKMEGKKKLRKELFSRTEKLFYSL